MPTATLTPRTAVNAHIHLPPNFSAFDTIAQAATLASEQGVGVLGASNYYDYSIYRDFEREAGARGVFPLFGLEIIALIPELVERGVKLNDPGNPGKMYICGKGINKFDPLSPAAAELLGVIRANDSARMAQITDKLAELFAGAGIETGLDPDAIKQRIVARHGCRLETVYLQERHLAQAFQERLFDLVAPAERDATLTRLFAAPQKSAPDDAVGIQNEIRSSLMKAGKAAFVPDTFVGFDHAYALILALGGIPCYPVLADGTSPICGYEADIDALAADLTARGVYAVEFITNRNSTAVASRYVRALRHAGFIVTAGTEHNTLDLLPIEPVCTDGPVPDDLKAIFWEGACVVAAHQTETTANREGYAAPDGSVGDASTRETRIARFAEIGELAIGGAAHNASAKTTEAR